MQPLVPAKAGTQKSRKRKNWIPACAGMSGEQAKHAQSKTAPVCSRGGDYATAAEIHSAAMRTSGCASRTSASTWVSNCTKFFWNIATSSRAVLSNSDLFAQVLNG